MIDKILIGGAITLLGMGVEAVVKWHVRHARRRRLDPAVWSNEDLALLVARKQLENERTARERAAFAQAMATLDPGHRPRPPDVPNVSYTAGVSDDPIRSKGSS